MEAQQERPILHEYKPSKRPLAYDDEIFNLGNVERELLAKQKAYQITTDELNALAQVGGTSVHANVIP